MGKVSCCPAPEQLSAALVDRVRLSWCSRLNSLALRAYCLHSAHCFAFADYAIIHDSEMCACQSGFGKANNLNSLTILGWPSFIPRQSCCCTAADLVQEAAHGASARSTKTTHDSLWRGQVGVIVLEYAQCTAYDTTGDQLMSLHLRSSMHIISLRHASFWHEHLLSSSKFC